MTSDELVEKLGDKLSHIYRMMSGENRFMAVEIGSKRAFGKTLRESLQNLLDEKYGYMVEE